MRYQSNGAFSFSVQPIPLQICHPKKHFVFVKVHKCSSSTVAGVLRKYALENNLTIALPSSQITGPNLGWPVSVLPKYIYRYGIMKKRGIALETVFHHHHFNLKTWRSVMPRDTVYLAVMREPLDQLRSAMGFISALKRRINGTDQRKVGTFNENRMIKLLSVLSPRQRCQIYNFYANPKANHFWLNRKNTVFSWTKNFMAFSLGFSQKAGMAAAKKYLQHIDGVFDLVILTEYFMESMLLLRRRMCWSMRDVTFIRLNSKVTKTVEYPEELYNKSRAWNTVDHLFYDHFKRKLLQDISKENNFQDELERFKEVNEYVNRFCDGVLKKNGVKFIIVPASYWNDEFRFSEGDCESLVKQNGNTRSELRTYLDSIIDAPKFDFETKQK
ncbi:galactose-3-O-sulfotransferase 2-like [Lineus longissimus]|uniref:galactose-3-O-sulfotransferase 2-like n=1 Tax=Lineus longissimus TaxID=88925 RepID=UPI00315D833A